MSQSGDLKATTASNTSRKASKPYKIVLESVTQEKKKLQSVISYNDEAPPGYTFVPVGVPELTEYCKEISREKGLDVYIVSTTPQSKAHTNPENISHHIHRIGHHFRNQVVEQACEVHGFRHRGQKYVQNASHSMWQPLALARKLDEHGQRLGQDGSSRGTEATIEQVRATIKELFPKIPEVDCEAIVSRAFKEGTNRVGNAERMTLPRRVQLAVVAHIRHNYTDYDALLHIFSWHQARQMVEQSCLDQIVKWRDEDEKDVIELEDIFQEVVVIDDDDDDDDPGEQVSTKSTSEFSRDNNRRGESEHQSENFTGSSADRRAALKSFPSLEIVSTKTRPDSQSLYDEQAGVARLHEIQIEDHSRELITKRSNPDIIHVKPQRDLRTAPVLTWQEQLQRRYNRARARIGYAEIGIGSQLSNPINSVSLSNSTPIQRSIMPSPSSRPDGNGDGAKKNLIQRLEDMQSNTRQLPPHLRPTYVPLSTDSERYSRETGSLPSSLRPIYVPEDPSYSRAYSHADSEQFSEMNYPSNLGVEYRPEPYMYTMDARPDTTTNFNRPAAQFDTHALKRKSHSQLNPDEYLATDQEVGASHKRPRQEREIISLGERRSHNMLDYNSRGSSRSDQGWNNSRGSLLRSNEVIDLTSSPKISTEPFKRPSRVEDSPRQAGHFQPPSPRHRHEVYQQAPLSESRKPVFIDETGKEFYSLKEARAADRHFHRADQRETQSLQIGQAYPAQRRAYYEIMPPIEASDSRAYAAGTNHHTSSMLPRASDKNEPQYYYEQSHGETEGGSVGSRYGPGGLDGYSEYEYIEPGFGNMRISRVERAARVPDPVRYRHGHGQYHEYQPPSHPTQPSNYR